MSNATKPATASANGQNPAHAVPTGSNGQSPTHAVSTRSNGETWVSDNEGNILKNADKVRTVLESAEQSAKRKQGVIAKMRQAIATCRADGTAPLPKRTSDAYLVRELPKRDKYETVAEANTRKVETVLAAHLAHASLKMPGKSQTLEILAAAMMVGNIIGLAGFSGRGKTASVMKFVAPFVNNPSEIVIIDGGQRNDKEDLVGEIDPDNTNKPQGLIHPGARVVFIDEFTRLHSTKMNVLVKILEERVIRLGRETVKLHEDVIFILAYNGSRDLGATQIPQAILDRMGAIIQYEHITDAYTLMRAELPRQKEWDKMVGLPAWRGTKWLSKLRNHFSDRVQSTPIKLRRHVSKMVTESRHHNFWDDGSQLSERAPEDLSDLTYALALIRGVDLDNFQARRKLIDEVLWNSAFEQFRVHADRDGSKEEVFTKYLATGHAAARNRELGPNSHSDHTEDNDASSNGSSRRRAPTAA